MEKQKYKKIIKKTYSPARKMYKNTQFLDLNQVEELKKYVFMYKKLGIDMVTRRVMKHDDIY